MIETSQDFRVLWLKVIRRAQEEADGMYASWSGEDPEKLKRHARKWLTHPSRGFCLVCEMAGFSWDQTKRLMEEMRRRYGNE